MAWALFISLSLAIVLAISLKSRQNYKVDKPTISLPNKPDSQNNPSRIAYRSIEVSGKAKCFVIYDKIKGVEMQGKLFGLQQARIAFDRTKYWFWLRNFDPEKYYFCDSSEVSSSDLIPVFRPSFTMWMLNNDVKPTSYSFKDGEYTVEITKKEGSIINQKYTRNDAIETEVSVIKFQQFNGVNFPKIVKVFIREYDLLVKVDMGQVEVDAEHLPDTKPPKITGEKLKVLR